MSEILPEFEAVSTRGVKFIPETIYNMLIITPLIPAFN